MKKYVTCLTIAGSDSGGGAGIQADIKTMSALGVFATSAITAITAQNTTIVNDIHAVPSNIIESQICSVIDDIGCNAVKIGMVYSAENAEVIGKTLKRYNIQNIVLDPVLISTSNCELSSNNCIEAIKENLIPISLLVTPNIEEAQKLTNIKIENTSDIYKAANSIIDMGAKSVLIKGGHFINSRHSSDYFLSNNGYARWYKSKVVETNNLHGTGCTLSSAIASYLAIGYELNSSIELAKKYITKAITYGCNIKTGYGNGPVNHLFMPKKLIINDYED